MLSRTALISEARKTVVLVVGFILISVGVFTYMFPCSNYVTGVLVGISYPYRTYSVPLSVVGFALIVVVFFLDRSGRKAAISEQVE